MTEPQGITPPEDVDIDEVLPRQIRCTETGIIVDGDLPFDKWAKGFEFFQKIGSKTQWWRGEMLLYGEKHFGESYAQVVDLQGKSDSRLSTYMTVCTKFPPERRRSELSFDHHAECCSLRPQDADPLLLRAIRERWTKMDVRKETAAINERNGVPPSRAGRRSTKSIAKQVAASGKEPQVPEGEKPLIWNGYPLRVGKPYEGANERIVFQGNEPLQEGETERAAHENKFAHKEAMMNWLEEHNFIKPEGEVKPCETQNAQASAAHKTAETPTAHSTAGASVSSNGAAPNATESAPTPVITWRIQHPGTMLWVDIDSFDDGMKRWFEGFNPPRKLIDGIEEAPDAASNRVKAHYAGTTEAPAAPPASPEPPKAAETSKEHQEQLWELQHACDSMRAERDDAKQDATKLADELSKLRSSMHQYAATPLQRAEESLLVFAAASESVNWEEIGANKLLRSKWLERLLLPCDLVIDRIQGAAIKGKN